MKRINIRFSLVVALLAAAFMSVQATDNNDYLHFISLKNGCTLRLDRVDYTYSYTLDAQLEYSTDNRKSWTNYTWGEDEETGASIAFANAGDTIWFRAGQGGTAVTNTQFSTRDNHYQFVFGNNDSIAAGGNVMSLYDGTCQKDTMTAWGFLSLFEDCKALTKAPSLPATGLAASCYYDMFFRCTSLTTAPSLPATQLADLCYNHMFHSCSSLKTAPTLEITQLAPACFDGMFYGCSLLKVDTCDGNCAGALLEIPNTTQSLTNWNRDMFQGCQGPYANNIKIGGHYCIMGKGFTLTVEANDTTMGSVTGGGIYDCGDTVTVTATAKAGYKFVGWSTGDTAATHTFIMFNQDSTITATFALASGVEEIEIEKYVAYAESGNIIVNGVTGCAVAIYDMNGRLVGKTEKANETERFTVGISGVYVVTVDNKAEAKVIVK